MRNLLRLTTAYRAISADALRKEAAHACLVVFPDEKYLRPLLRECAKAFFAAEDDSRVAELIDKESYSDCLFFPAAGGKLTADDGAHIIDESLLRPVEGDKKLFVLDGFHNASAIVQNKLLKILEEPPRGVHFLLGAATEYSVLATVLSRVKKFAESPFSEEAVFQALNRIYPARTGLREAAAACGGIFSAAEALLSGGGEDFALAERLLLGRETEKLSREIGDRKDKKVFLSALRLVLRDMLLLKTGQGKYAARTGGQTEALAREYPAGAIVFAIERVAEAEKQVTFNANFGQCVETLAIAIGKEKIKWQKLS